MRNFDFKDTLQGKKETVASLLKELFPSSSIVPSYCSPKNLKEILAPSSTNQIYKLGLTIKSREVVLNAIKIGAICAKIF